MTWEEQRTAVHTCCLALTAAGIGTLLAAWLVSQPGVQPVLLGRSGCFGSTLPDLLLADAPVTAVRCDAAVAAEAAAALAASAEGQLSAVLHAGGVLQDGVLRQQTAASLRVVCGPKLGFLRHAVVAGQLQPLGAVNLLSSVSAFVGSPGQANYAAANAALDCWAAALQQHGTPGKWGTHKLNRALHVRVDNCMAECHLFLFAPLSQAVASSGAPGQEWAWRTATPLC